MHNPPANPQKCYNEARGLEIKSHWITVRNHQIAKHNPHFRLQQYILRKQFFFEAGKGKGSRRQKNIHITNRITKFLVPSFNKYSRNEISTRYQQCRRQTKRSEMGPSRKWTELLHIKADILKLQFCNHLWKKIQISLAAFISSFRMRPIQLLEKYVYRSECDQKRNQGFVKREGA